MTTVSITAEDIADGEPGHCENSAEARAILRAFTPHGFVFASVDDVLVTAGRDHENPDSFVFAVPPPPLEEFMAAVAAGRSVEPITFDLDLGVLDLARLT